MVCSIFILLLSLSDCPAFELHVYCFLFVDVEVLIVFFCIFLQYFHILVTLLTMYSTYARIIQVIWFQNTVVSHHTVFTVVSYRSVLTNSNLFEIFDTYFTYRNILLSNLILSIAIHNLSLTTVSYSWRKSINNWCTSLLNLQIFSQVA